MHLDGICRRSLPSKLSGVFDSIRSEDDPLFFNTAVSVPVPHSRRNDVADNELAAKGYRILSRLENGQVDIFTREPPGYSRFVFFQGHPEYDPATLGREYLRDMGRYLRGEIQDRPAIPHYYFDRATEDRLQGMPIQGRDDLSRFSEVVVGALPRQSWRANTIKLFSNWLTMVAATKMRRAASRSVHVRRRAS
jgi:homoserine O-succinyltransferase